jgi:PAS domain S-box-containing protein
MIDEAATRVDEQSSSFIDRARALALTAIAHPDADSCVRHLRVGLIDLGFSRAGIWIVDPADATRFRGTWGTSWDGTELDEHDLAHPIGSFLNSARIVLGERVVIRRYARPAETTIPAHLPHVRPDGPPNTANAAIRTTGQLLGIISVDMLLSDDVIETQHVAALETIGEIVAVKLAPSDLIGSLRAANDQLRAAIEATRQSETRYRTVAEPASDFTYWMRVHSDGTIENEWIAESVERITGYSPREAATLLGQPATTHPDDLILVQQNIRDLCAGQPTAIQYRTITKYGETKWLRLRGWPVWDDAHRRVSRIYVETQDITERKRADEARQEIEALYDAAKQITASLDLTTTLGSILDAVVKLSGSSTAGISLLDATGSALTIAAARGQYADAIEGLKLSPGGVTGTVASTGEVFVSSDLLQDRRWIPAEGMDPQAIRSGLFVPLKVDERVIGVLSAWSHHVDYFTPTHQRLLQGFSEQASLAVQRARDIEQRRRLEEQLRQSQKMEAIGQLAGGVAHDFNNLLTVMSGYGQLLLNRLRPNTKEYRELQEILKAAESAATLTRQLLAFSRRQIVTLREIDLNDVVEQLGKMLRRVIGEDITFATVLAPSLGRIRADTGQMEQVLMNLAANARDAMPTGGKLTIETRNVVLTASDVRDPSDAPVGPHVMLAISDTGVGMSSETMAHIFEPFFTTKEVGRGTGLGLAAVYGAVTQSGGSIRVVSELGRGTTFTLYFPRVDSPACLQPAPVSQLKLARGTETILIVEDEASVRALARTALETSGYTVLEADGGEQALGLAAAYPERIDLLVADVVMPGVNGSQVVENVVARHPSVKVLYVSGYTSDVVVRHGVIEDRVNFLQKPYTPVTLCAKVREILDRP